MDAQQSGGFVVWLTGMARTGKTTLGAQLARRFAAVGRRVECLAGDDPDELLTQGLGVSKDDRIAAVRRLGYVARLWARNGAAVVVAHLSPHREARLAIPVSTHVRLLQLQSQRYGRVLGWQAIFDDLGLRQAKSVQSSK